MTDVGRVKERSEVDEQMKWDLSKLYRSTEEWESDLKTLEAKVPEIGRFRGELS
jgi:oligoendopeptidase F